MAAICTNVGLSADVIMALEVSLGCLQDQPRLLALLSCGVLLEATRAARITLQAVEGQEGRAQGGLSPVEAAQDGLVWRFAKTCEWLAAGGTWAEFIDMDPFTGEVVHGQWRQLTTRKRSHRKRNP